MPAVSHAKTPCIGQLASELGYASKPTLLRHLERIDELAPQIDPDGIYPEDWIVFRITGYRPEIDSPVLVPGEALRGDLSALAERISESAKITPADIHNPYETIDSLCKRWGVSRKTIERYRRLGLIARRLDLGRGRRSVVFMSSAVEWFETHNRDRLGKAQRFDRFTQSQINHFARLARGYRRRLGWSRSQSAARIAARTGHSHEGIRKALLRIDHETDAPIFTDPGPTTTRDQMFALRASMRGIEPGRIADRLGRTRSATLRAINTARTGVIASIEIPGLSEGSPSDTGVDEVLSSPAVCSGLTTRPPTDLRELIDAMKIRQPTVVYEETMRARALSILMNRVSESRAELASSLPSGPMLDAIETDLRFAAMLKSALIESHLHLIGLTIEHQIDGQIDTLDPSRALFLIFGSIRVAGMALDRYDPSHSARLAAPIGLAVTRFVSRQPDIAQPTDIGKATRWLPLGHTITPWNMLVTPWLRWLMPDARVEGVLDRLDERDGLILNRRFGFDGHPPMTRRAVAKMLSTTVAHLARFERAAIRSAIGIAREHESGS
ncbi:MAG: hypothetical protein ACWA5W_08600 [Phycisphaerales bacterium]